MFTPEYISLIIAALGFAASVYFSSRKIKENDMEKAVEEAKRDTAVNMKLDAIMASTGETSKKIDKLQTDMESMRLENTARKEQINGIEKRVTNLETRLGKLHQEHREHMQCIRETKGTGD